VEAEPAASQTGSLAIAIVGSAETREREVISKQMSDRPSRTPPKLRFPLWLTIPLALMVFVGGATGWSLHLGRIEASQSVRKEAIRDLTWTTSRLASMFEGSFRLGDIQTIQEQMAALGAEREIALAVLVDENHDVLHSMRIAQIGKPLTEVLPEDYKTASPLQPAGLAELRRSMRGQVQPVGAGITLVAAYPLVLGSRHGELRPNRVGYLIVASDHTSTEAKAFRAVAREALGFFTLTSLLGVALGLVFHLVIARRLKRLAQVTQQFAAGTPIRSGITGGDEVGSLAWSIDRMVQEKASADRQLQESEERYRGLFENTHDLVQSVSTEGDFIFVNPQWQAILGYSDDDLKTMKVSDIIHTDSIEHCQEVMQQVLAGKPVPSLEATLLAKDGRSVFVEGKVSPRFADGKVVATHGFFHDITQRKQATVDLAERGSRLQAILSTAAEGIITIDQRGVIESLNAAAESMFGYAPSELVGQNVKTLMPSPFHEKHDGYLVDYARTGEKKIIGQGRDVVGLRRDGTKFPLELSVSEINLADKKIYTGFLRDLTDRQRSEETEQSLGRIVEDSINEIYICSAESMRFIQANRGARANIGYTMDELRELTPVDIGQDFTADSLNELTEPLRSGRKKQLVFETVHRRKDGTQYDAEVHVQLATYQGQAALVAMVLDISKRKSLEQQTRLQGQALDTGATAIAFANPEGNLTYVNQAFRTMWGFAEKDELLGRPITEMSSSGDDVGEVLKGLRERGVWLGERLAKRKDGSTFEIQVSASLVVDDHGEPVTMMASFVDISDLKRVEASLAQLNDQLEQRVEERSRQLRETQQQLVRKEKLATLGQLAGSVAHEIRNPLAIIKNAIYFLDGQDQSDPDVNAAFAEINRALHTSNRIVGELLDFARDPKLEITAVGPREIIDRALSGVEIPDDITVERSCMPSELRIHADAGQIERILINLIQNAVHAMPDGGNLRVHGCYKGEGQFVIEVIDTGHGIEQDHLGKVFEPLFSDKAKGFGLGLALCKRYAELNQGTLSVESRLGVGSTFRLSLPCDGQPKDR
jgi:PAS domain S-box-containing protein